MSPTVFRFKGYRFFFFSREEDRIHIHVIHAEGEAKVWIEPDIELQSSYGLSSKQIKVIIEQITEHEDEIRESWDHHFGK